MSESHYWPLSGEIGVYDIDHDSGAVWKEAMWTGDGWVVKGKMAPPISQTEAIAMGYLGVRREQTVVDDTSDKYAEAELHADAFNWRHAKSHGIEITVDGDVIGRATYWCDSGDSSVGIPATGGWELAGSEVDCMARRANDGDDLTALIREAIADFRANVKQPTKAADWAFKWVNRFIQAVKS